METIRKLFLYLFSNENISNVLPSYSRILDIMYQTKEIVNKINWYCDGKKVY